MNGKCMVKLVNGSYSLQCMAKLVNAKMEAKISEKYNIYIVLNALKRMNQSN